MRVLVVDDNPDHRELIISRVRKAYPEAQFEEVVRQSMFDEKIEQGTYDLFLTDYRLHWSDGLKILSQIRRKYPTEPVIMVTDTGSEEVAAAGMKAGLSDYVLKGHLHRLPLAIQEALDKTRLRREREEALERLRVSEERYRAVSELSSDYAYSYYVEPDGTVVREWITQAFTRITGYSIEELDGGVLLPLVHPEDRHFVEEGRTTLLSGQPYSCEMRILTKDKRLLWVRDSARPVWDEAGNRVVRIYGAGQDITGQKRAEEERAQLIREQAARSEAEAGERRYRSLAEAIPQIVWTARPDGHVDYFNRRWFDYTCLTESETYANDPWRTVIHPDDVQSARQQWARAVATGSVYDVQFRFRRASDGTHRWHLVRAVPLRDSDGGIVKWFGTCTDIDDQRRSSEAMREAQKLESIGLLAGGVAHDFNNLLTGILGNASLVLDELPEDSRFRPMLDAVMLASERAADLTRQLLAYSGKGRLFVQQTDLSALVRDISTLIQSSIPKKVELRLDLAGDLPVVEADPGQMQQLVMNLVINGAEAIGEDRAGTVMVSTGVVDVDEQFVQRNHFALDGVKPGRYVSIRVRDNGYGMDESVRPHIFDPFFTTKFTGRGLGLAAALGIVRGHHGAIRIETEPGKGTMFEILLPACTSARPKAELSVPSRELRGAGEILVIDDEEVVRSAAKAALERYGYTVQLAPNGKAGLELFAERAANIRLVLLDMLMPVMSGDETLKALRRIRPDVPVIGSSGYNAAVARERFGNRGLAGFVQKPYTAQVLADCVKAVLEDRCSHASAREI